MRRHMGNFFESLKKGLEKTRKSFTERVNEVFNLTIQIDEDMYDELEEVLVTSDVGVQTSEEIIEKLKEKIMEKKVTDVSQVRELLREVITEYLTFEDEKPATFPVIFLIIGVNGVGKTTSIGKLAYRFKEDGKKVLIAAGDTFRAAAIDQVGVWAQRAGVDLIKHQEGSDPAAVVYDALNAAKARGADVLLIDTAGRLHNKKNLMGELEKINKIIDREYPEASKLSLLVLDATTGQNAITQAREFKSVAEINGLILTKLDGTAKGGVVLSIKNILNVPVKYIGLGEGIDDLHPFYAEEFAELLLDDGEE